MAKTHFELTVLHKENQKIPKNKQEGFSVSAQGIICFPRNKVVMNCKTVDFCHIVCSMVIVWLKLKALP